MKRLCLLLAVCSVVSISQGQPDLIPAFRFETNPIVLQRAARPTTYFDKVGRRFALLGCESGSVEAWAYPLKLVRNLEFAFFLGSSTEPIRAAEIVRWISAAPEVTTLTYTYQSFTIRAHYITPIDEPGALILLDVDSAEPLTIVCSFLPSLQPMWPAGIGGQYAYWDDETKAYRVSEPTRKNHAYVGSPAASGMSSTPAHMLSDHPNQFKIVVARPSDVRGKFIPVAIAGGKGSRDSIQAVYKNLLRSPQSLYQKNVEHYRRIVDSTIQIRTPDTQLNLAFQWAKVAYDNLIVNNPDLGLGFVAGLGPAGTSGRPGFGWFFGGDMFINSFSMNSFGAHKAVRDGLAFTQKWQRADGKMAHEVSQAAAYIRWFEDYPYAYIHGDTSPFYITAVEDYFRSTADTTFVRESWSSLLRAYEWCLSTDENGDGLMDNKRAGLGASEYGALTDVQSDIYTAAVWIRATRAMETLSLVAGDSAAVIRTRAFAAKTHDVFHKLFWDNARGQYSYAFDKKGNHVSLVSPWSSVGMMWGLGTPDASRRTLEKLNSAEITTDWGARSISAKSELFEPLNYNYGAVWPFLTSWVATAQYKHDFSLQGYASLMASVRHTFDNGLGSVTEVFSGTHNIWPQEAVAHQGFCSAGVVLPFVRGMLGLEVDAPRRTITVAPRFPADWKQVTVGNVRVGTATCSFTYSREKNRVTLRGTCSDTLTLVFAPVLGASVRVLDTHIMGNAAIAAISRNPYAVQPSVSVRTRGPLDIDFTFSDEVEVLPPLCDTKTGDTNRGIKIISCTWTGTSMVLVVEGLAGESYRIPLLANAPVDHVTGGVLDGGDVLVSFPDAERVDFARKEITIVPRPAP